MTSSSVNSVPAAQLALLRQRLLQPQEPDDGAKTATSPPTHMHATDASGPDSEDVSGQAPATVPESANTCLTPQSSPKAQHPPRMNVSKSASEVEMEAMVNPSPSQEGFLTMTRASSFHGYPGGDTQLMESQVYRDFNASAVKSNIAGPAKAAAEFLNEQGYTCDDTCRTEETQHTFVEGDTGFINVVNAMTSPNARSPTAFDPDFEVTQVQEESSPTAGVFMPQTPAITAHKRRHSSEVMTSVTTAPKTLALSQLFGGKQDRVILSATQAFNQTQAPSSPIPDGPRSDPAFTRPSPNLNAPLRTSSPLQLSVSSPIEIMRPSTASEPRDNYTRICESQERRASMRSRAAMDTVRNVDDYLLEDDEVGMDDTLRKVHRKRLQRVKSDQALLALSKVGAPSRRTSRNTPRLKTASMIDLVTPAAVKEKNLFDLTTLDDEEPSEEDMPPDDEALGIGEEDNDQYDELAQTVIKSQRNDAKSELNALFSKDADENDRVTEDHGPNRDAVPQPKNVDANEIEGSIPPRTQHSTVADSQPIQRDLQQSIAQQNKQPRSSTVLFVPGSQYAGKTSQDQARLAKSSWTLPEQLVSSPTGPRQERVPSSPLLPATDAIDSDLVVAEHAHAVCTAQQVIPWSDLPMSDIHHADSSRPVSTHGRVEGESNDAAGFSTAPTHFSQPVPFSRNGSSLVSPLKIVASQQSQNASQSPITAAGVRRLSDIAALQSPKASNETQVSVDGVMNDIMTADDEQFFQVMSSPINERPLKRRRLGRAPNASGGGPGVEASGATEAQVAVNDGIESAEGIEDATTVEAQEDEASPPKPLRESPSKANEMPSNITEHGMELDEADVKAVTRSLTAIRRTAWKRRGTVLQANDGAATTTTESIPEREEPGARAASQLISKRSSKPGQLDLSRTLAEKQTKTKPRMKGKGGDDLRQNAKTKAAVSNHESSRDRDVEDLAVPTTDGSEGEVQRILAPRRIFTLFKGTHNNFYAATWLHSLPDGLNHRVKFDDGTQTTIEIQHIRRLELRVGDQVKINMDGMRGKNWQITGFTRSIENGAADTDIYGHQRVHVQIKSPRASLPSSTAVGEMGDKSNEVAISEVYLTHTMWPQLNDRLFQPPCPVNAIASRAATPSSTAQIPGVETPNSRSRRKFAAGATGNNVRSSYVRDESVMNAASSASIGLFTGMAFAISYGSHEGEKDRVMRAISSQGGLILERGFDELFDVLSAVDDTTASPGKKAFPAQVEASGIKLRPQYKGLGFVALIADRHGRRAKYMQALALGIPTLSSRWVLDSLDTSRNASLVATMATPLPWPKYLLPAGESAFLGGAIRSRTISEYAFRDASLSDVLDQRSLLLNGDGVLIVAPKKGKEPWERCKTYTFLTLALGAGVVRRVADLQEAKALTIGAPGAWKWVYVDGSVAEASSIVFGKRGTGGKKRKRDADQATKGEADAMCMSNGAIKVVNDEFVVQSLILGALFD